MKLLEHLANQGKAIDRNLIIVTLYNLAASYQRFWNLEKTAKYMDGVIYNIEASVAEDNKIFLVNNKKYTNT